MTSTSRAPRRGPEDVSTAQAAVECMGAPDDVNGYAMGYQWPASRLTRADMIKLTILRNRTRQPITLLLHEAVSALYELLKDSSASPKDGS